MRPKETSDGRNKNPGIQALTANTMKMANDKTEDIDMNQKFVPTQK